MGMFGICGSHEGQVYDSDLGEHRPIEARDVLQAISNNGSRDAHVTLSTNEKLDRIITLLELLVSRGQI